MLLPPALDGFISPACSLEVGATPRGLANDSLPFPSPPEDITRGFLAAGAISGSGLEPLEPCFSVVDFEWSSCRGVFLMAVTLGKVVRSVVPKV
jgi:hypothetical protein